MVHALTGGGAERVAASWANGLSRLGHDVEILTNLDKAVTYMPDSKVKLIPSINCSNQGKNIISKIFNRIKLIWIRTNQLIKIFRQSNPEVIVNVLYLDVISIQLARMLSFKRIPIVMTDHNSYERPESAKMRFGQWWNKFVDNRFFNQVTVLTEPDKKILEKKGIRNVRVLHNPLFLTPCKEVPKKDKIVLSIGRLNAWHVKGFDILIRAWKKVYVKHPDWRLKIKGNHNEQVIDMLRKIAGDYSESIDFVDYDEDVVSEYQQASIYVLSSRYEGWGLVAVEAMSQGCATVACDYKGRQAEFIEDGVNGLLCEPENPDMLADKIIELIENEDLRTSIQKAAPSSVNEFDEKKVAKRLLSIIEEVVK